MFLYREATLKETMAIPVMHETSMAHRHYKRGCLTQCAGDPKEKD
jgi:hypothetical protein